MCFSDMTWFIQRDTFQVIPLDRTGHVSGMAVLRNKVLQSRLDKVSGTQNRALPQKEFWVETKNRGKEEQRLTWSYSLSRERSCPVLLQSLTWWWHLNHTFQLWGGCCQDREGKPGLSQGTCKGTTWQWQQGKKQERTLGKALFWSTT